MNVEIRELNVDALTLDKTLKVRQPGLVFVYNTLV